jgi:hypothetical protein
MVEDKEKDKTKELSEKAKENLRRNEELRRSFSKFQTVQPGKNSWDYLTQRKWSQWNRNLMERRYSDFNTQYRILILARKNTGL